MNVKIYLGDDVQRPFAIVSVTFTRFPIVVIKPVRAQVLRLRRCSGDVMRQSLSHRDIVARRNGELYPASVRLISTLDTLTGYWQIRIEDQPRWSRIALVYHQLV